MSRYTDNELGHKDESDGIEEYDNPLPDWWVGMFILTIVWGVLYGANYHFVQHNSQAKLYDQEVAEAYETWPALKAKAAFDDSPETLALGKETFDKNCVSCHTAALTGGIGPNLVDDRWIHGNKFDDVAKTITEGVLAKGMPAWGPILGPKAVSAAASFVLSKNEGEAARAKTTAMGAYAEGGASVGNPVAPTP